MFSKPYNYWVLLGLKPPSTTQGSGQVETSGCTYLPDLASSPDYASDQESPQADSPLNIGGTSLSDGDTPTREVSGATGDTSLKATSLKREEGPFP